MKKISIYLACFGLLFSFASSCDDENGIIGSTTEINLNFKPYFDSTLIVMGTTYFPYNDTANIRVDRYSFFISDIVLLTDLGETELMDVAKVKFSDISTLALAQEGVTVNTGEVAVGTYTGIRFGIGVIADLNRMTPDDFSDVHPLGANSIADYWSTWSSYRFISAEGYIDADKNESIADEEDFSYLYHLAAVDNDFEKVYHEVQFDRSIIVAENAPITLNFKADLKKMFFEGENVFDFNPQRIHDENPMEVIEKLATNFSHAITLEE